MTEEEAVREAEKREKHKSKHMVNKRWEAVHDSVKGWHVVLVDVIKLKPKTFPLSEEASFRIELALALYGSDAVIRAMLANAKDRRP